MARQSRTPYIIAFILFVCGISYMVYSGISQNSLYFLNVSEALAMETKEIGAARLFGTVSDSIEFNEDGLIVNFHIKDAADSQSDLAKYARDNNEQASTNVGADLSKPLVNKHGRDYIAVQYKGVVPDTFDVGVEVIIEGVMHENGFEAKTLMTKCPSKYEGKDIKDMPAQA